jgi:hypothetical protein
VRRSSSPLRPLRSSTGSSARRPSDRSSRAPRRPTSPRKGRYRAPSVLFARALERHYGCTPAQVAFWDIHEQADRDHSAIGDHVVVRLATSPALQADVRRAVTRSLELWWQFFDGIARVTDAG